MLQDQGTISKHHSSLTVIYSDINLTVLRFGHLRGEQALHIETEKTGNMTIYREVRVIIQVIQISLIL